MKHRFETIDESELEDFSCITAACGKSYEEFKLQESVAPAPFDSELFVVKGSVRITYKPSGVSREYETGQGTSWPTEFERDLVGGAFVRR